MQLSRQWLDPLAIVLFTCLLVYACWIGYIASDDGSYAFAGRHWVENFPYLGTSHFGLRHPLTLLIAVSFASFGVSEFSLALPVIAMTLAIILGIYYVLTPHTGRNVALLAAIATSTVPVFASHSSIANVDIIESAFVLASVFFFARAIESPHRLAFLFLAGVLAGVAFSARETAAALVAFYVILFLLGFRGVPRWSYFVIGAGFITIFAIEILAYTIAVGDPLYRLNISLQHDTVDRSEWATGIVDNSGSLSLSPILDPIIMVFLNNEFALVFWAFVPAATWALRRNSANPQLATMMRLLTILTLTWFGFVALNASILYLVPRYMLTGTISASLVVMCWATLAAPRKLISALIITAIVGANAVALSLENRDPLFAERNYVKIVAQEDEVVYTDPRTHLRASFLGEIAGVSTHTSAQPPQNGGLYYYAPDNAARGYVANMRFNPDDYRPGADYALIRTLSPTKKWPGALLEWLDLELPETFPAPIRRKLIQPNSATSLYRVTEAAE